MPSLPSRASTKFKSTRTQIVSHYAYKMDLSKAYDRVDWSFLEKAMSRLGLWQTWIQWIMACVRSIRFAVCLNGSTLSQFIPTRGLRQGDPLSPYLFLVVGEVLTYILKHEVNGDNITPLKVARRAPGIDVYACVCSCRQCWASKCRGL
jgi:hypothetical protein